MSLLRAGRLLEGAADTLRAMSIRIVAGPRFDSGTFHKALSGTVDNNQHLLVDLRKCIFVDPYTLIELVTLMERARRLDWEVLCRLPKAKGRDTYFARMHFFDVLPGGVAFDRKPPVVEEHAATLVPLMRLDLEQGEWGVDQIANWVYPQLPIQLAERFTNALAEIGMNVIAHSHADAGFVVGQRYNKDYQGRMAPRLHLAVGDDGIGMKSSLMPVFPELENQPESAAIMKAKEWYVTGKPDKHSGVGLSTVQEYADMFGGVLRIRSGESTVVRRRGIDQVLELPGISGTIVSVELCSPGRDA